MALMVRNATYEIYRWQRFSQVFIGVGWVLKILVGPAIL